MSTNKNNILEVIVVTQENIVEKFKEFSFDQDLNGSNGKEYLSDKAKEDGFDSDLQMILSNAETKTKGVQNFCNYVENNLPDCYQGTQIIATPVGKHKYVISFMQLMEY
jgi:hypothetical protein